MIVPTTGPKDAKIFIVGEAPGQEEAALGQPFVGSSGRLLNAILSQAGINRHNCLIGNVAKERPDNNYIGNYYIDKGCTNPKPIMEQYIGELKKELEETRPNVIVALGATALYTLCGVKGIDSYRGRVLDCTLVKGLKVISASHPARVLRDWSKLFPTIMDLKKAKKQSEFPEIQRDNRLIKSDINFEEFMNYCNFLLSDEVEYISFDLEIMRETGHITWIGLGHSENFACSFKILTESSSTGSKIPCYPANIEKLIWDKLADVFTSNKKFIAQNAQFDMSILYKNHGVLVRNLWMDTMIAAHVCWTGLPKDLEFLTSMCLTVPAWKYLAKSDMGTYNALDVINTFGVAMFLDKEIESFGVRNTYKFEMTQLEVAMMLGLQGMKVDISRMSEVKAEAERLKAEVLVKLEEATEDSSINYNSPKQVKNLLYVTLNLPMQFARRKNASEDKKITTDTDALSKLAVKTGNPIPELIVQYRTQQKLLSNYLNFKVSENNRVYSSYNITGTITGRWSSSKSIVMPFGPGNLQNIPPFARKLFLPEEGKVLLQADYVQAEAVVVAYLTGDEQLKNAFKNGDDVHKLTASMMFDKPIDEINKEERQIGKLLRHASNYSAGPGVIVAQLKCSMPEAKKLLKLYHDSAPLLRLWHESVKKELEKNMTLTTPMGRKRKFLDRWGDQLFRSAFAFLPQSTIGDLLNESLCTFYNKYAENYDILLQIHDAFIISVKESELQEASKAMKECMVRPLIVNRDTMTVGIDYKMGKTWGELKAWSL